MKAMYMMSNFSNLEKMYRYPLRRRKSRGQDTHLALDRTPAAGAKTEERTILATIDPRGIVAQTVALPTQ